MAIKKQVVQPNGVMTEYHRVAMVKIDTNCQNTILLLSYINEAARQYEKDYAAGLIKEPTFPYVETNYHNPEYNGVMSVRAAYDWVKNNLPQFKDAVDVLGENEADNISGDEFLSMVQEVL